MKSNKNKLWRILIPVALLAIVIGSCKSNFLDRQPLGRFTEDDLGGSSFDSRVFAAYALLRADGLNNHLYLGINSYRSDEAMKGSSSSDGADQALMYDDFSYDKSNGGIQDYWTANYELLLNVNALIEDIDSIGMTDPGSVINLGEAKFLRAWAFFNLVRTFGQVPLVNFKVINVADVNIPKSPESAIYAQIDADLTDAESSLPVSWDAQYPGRLTSGAANALHARTYMFRSEWASALGKANAVISSNQYGLVQNYGSQFRVTGENGPESIFEIQAYFDQANDYGILYANVQGVRGAGNWDLGWGWNVPTQDLVDEFEAGDPREIETILFSGTVDPLYGENVPSVPTIPQPYWNKKIYTSPADRTAFNNRFGRWMNHRIIRYADVLLMAAEAANEIGGPANTTSALGWLEMVRARARAGNAAILPAVVSIDQAVIREAIRHERFVEFGMEEQRFFDLVRWGIDVDVLHAHGKPAYQVKHRLLPIPQGEIDKSNGVLIQNPNY